VTHVAEILDFPPAKRKSSAFNIGGSSGRFCVYIRHDMVPQQREAPLKTKRFRPIIFSPRRRGGAAPIRPAQFNAFHNIASCATSGRAPPRSLQAKEAARFQDLYIEAKALTVQYRSLSRSPLRPRRRDRTPVGLLRRNILGSARRPTMPCACRDTAKPRRDANASARTIIYCFTDGLAASAPRQPCCLSK